ncbi:unnamed protein product [Microthlaspi erraticum]|uniref:Anticodon-binding domain-containing protein n=1 Tax=Microthlaspi erraticum TaxID=1685480 RepID=A0A6D2HR91_9BRAS|nr:unnamed protein product [Microthlaspi erraticum]
MEGFGQHIRFFIAKQGTNVFRFSPLVAPIKCTVFSLVQSQALEEATKAIAKELTSLGISHKVDTTGKSIGKKYARSDELGVPFAIIVDSETLVTIRERDSKDQVRIGLTDVASVVSSLAEGKMPWKEVAEHAGFSPKRFLVKLLVVFPFCIVFLYFLLVVALGL